MMVAVWSWPLIPQDCSFYCQAFLYAFPKQTKARGLQINWSKNLTQESLIQSFNAQDQFRKALRGRMKAMPLIPNPLSSIFQLSNPCHSLWMPWFMQWLDLVLYAISGSHFYCWSPADLPHYVNQYTKPFNDISSVLLKLQKAPLLMQSAWYKAYWSRWDWGKRSSIFGNEC